MSEFPNLEVMTDMELVALQHRLELEKYPEDSDFRRAVLKELGKRSK